MLPEHVHSRNLADVLTGLVEASLPETIGRLSVRDVTLDSRAVRPGALFLACAGTKAHGLAHADAAIAGGACAILYDPTGIKAAPDLRVPTWPVADLADRAGEIAARFYGRPSERLFVVGVTGTDGKTSCAWLIAEAMRRVDRRCGYLGTLGFGDIDALSLATHTTPDATRIQHWLARMVDAGFEAAAMEVSSHALAQKRADAVAFDVAVLTQIGRDHLDYHGDDDAYASAKRRLFDHAALEAVVLNADDAYGKAWLDDFKQTDGPAPLAYGRDPQLGRYHRFVRIADVAATADGLELRFGTHVGTAQIKSRLIGLFNADNLAACLGVMLVRGIALDDAAAALAAVPTVPGRMQRIASDNPDHPLVIVDYAHTAGALEAALASVRAHTRGALHCVFGCGGDRDRGKRALMGSAAARLADHLWLTDDNPRSEDPAAIVAGIVDGFPPTFGPERYTVEHKRRRAIAAAIAAAGPADAVLIAGKGHETTQQYGSHIYEFDDRVVAGHALEAV